MAIPPTNPLDLNCGCGPMPWPPPLVPRNPPVPTPGAPPPLPLPPERKPCPNPNPRYNLRGPQVEPEAAFWTICSVPCVIRLDALTAETDNPNSPCFFEPYPTDPRVIKDEIEELIELASKRDDPEAVYSNTYRRTRRGISPFLQLRPQPIGAVTNVDRDPVLGAVRAGRAPATPDALNIARGEIVNPAFPVISTGRELARYFESETPGLAHRLALDALIRDQNWSPPRQALVWAALDVTIYSALLAAWYYKWAAGVGLPPCGPFKGTQARQGVSFRPRPIEMDYRVNVLYNRMVDEFGTGDDGRRILPDPSPGTPRHPAYPSGHSTYSAAASELLSYFFPDYTEEFDRLADNAGMARLWAGIHWRSDHCAGAKLGRCVARMVIAQLQRSCICPADPCPPDENACKAGPPTDAQLKECAKKFCECCGHEHPQRRPCNDLEICQPERATTHGPVTHATSPATSEAGDEGHEREAHSEGAGAAGATDDAAQSEQARGPQEGASSSGSSKEARDQSHSPQQGGRGGSSSQSSKRQARGPQEGGR